MFEFRNKYQSNSVPQNTPTQPPHLSASANSLIEPKEIEINGVKFIISKMPCTVAQEVIFNIPSGLIPIISNFSKSEEQAFTMLSYCERVYNDDRGSVPLISKEIINNHVPNFDTLIKLEYECLQYNFDFFSDGRALNFLNSSLSLAESKLSKILTDLLLQLSPQGTPHSTNSKPFTP